MVIHVHNVTDGEQLTFSLPLLMGEVVTPSSGKSAFALDGQIQVWNESSPTKQKLNWLLVKGSFKALVRLEPGKNSIHIKHGSEKIVLNLVLTDPQFSNFVRPVYIICGDDDGSFQGPETENCSAESALRRISFAAQLLQTFTAEKLLEHGFQRHTFQIEIDPNTNRPICHLFRSKLQLEEASQMTGQQLWTYFGKELMMSPQFDHKDYCKWYCFMSFTRYKPPVGDIPKTHSQILKYTSGHTALGGGGLALFGSGNLHTWAEDLQQLSYRFTDCRKIDRSKLMDDSAYREYYWANYSTGLGASLHELGHTFDLAHTKTGVMARGFDDIHRVFTVQRPQHINTDRECKTSNPISVPRLLSLGEIGGPPIESHARQYRDACYGSPFKKGMSHVSRSYSSSNQSPPPLLLKVETDFHPVVSQTSLTMCVKNYDGTETHRTIMQDEGLETVTEVTVSQDEHGGSISSTSSNISSSSSQSANTSCSSSSSSLSTKPFTLPASNEAELDNTISSVTFADGGAHWYRSSAVLLRFHKWFNTPHAEDSGKPPVLLGSCVKSDSGLRLVELRSEPEGQVFCHWEFLQDDFPLIFLLQKSRIKNVPKFDSTTQVITVLAEDNFGNILKKKLKMVDIED